MAKSRSRVADYAVYVVVRILVCIIQALSWHAALNLAQGLAWLAYRLNRRHRQVALDNLRHAFGHLDEANLDRLARASYLHLTKMLVEVIRAPRVLHHHNVYDYINHACPEDLPFLRHMAKTGPFMVVLGHFGNWEIFGYVCGLVGFRGAVVARRMDNPYLHHYLTHFRRNTGLTLLDKNTDYLRILDLLARGKPLGLIGDQDAGSRGQFVNFFGRPASTFKSIALLSLEYRAPILVIGAARVADPMKYLVYMEDVIRPEEYVDRADAAKAMTQRYTDALERLVRRHPEQYFWLHRRWKTQPQPRRAKKAA